MTAELAKKIGGSVAIKVAILGLLVAYLMMVYISSIGNRALHFDWILTFRYNFNILIGAAGVLAFAYLFGRRAGLSILIQHKIAFFVGFKYTILALIAGSFLASLISFFDEGIVYQNDIWMAIFDYICKPIFAIVFFGFLPSLFLGIILAWQIKRAGRFLE